MKTLKQLREEYDDRSLPQVTPEDLVLEEIFQSKLDVGEFKGKSLREVPPPSKMPNLLMFRRITYRRYPGNQVVALYYSKMVDKYLSIPYGPTGNLNLSEATVYDTMEELDLEEGAKWDAVKTGAKVVGGALKGGVLRGIRGAAKGVAVGAAPGLVIGGLVNAAKGAYEGGKAAYEKSKSMEEDWQSVNRKDKTDGLSQAAVNAYRRENPGSKLKTAVTEKNPTGKRASRRKSFCSRMGGMKKRLTSTKTARDPDSRINKALRRWNCEEDFKLKLSEMRNQQDEGFVGDTIEKGRQWAQDKVKGSKTFKSIQDFGHTLPGYENVKSSKEKFSKGDYWGAAKEAGKSVAKAVGAGAAVAGTGYAVTKALPAIASKVLGGGDSDSKDTGSKPGSTPERYGKPEQWSSSNIRKSQVKTRTPSLKSGDSAIDASRYRTVVRRDYEQSGKKQVAENKMSDLRNMINEGHDSMDLNINGRTVTLNTGMAKRILEVYDSVNTKNKKIVESMLNENLESFKKLLNFSIKA